jgi:hypothetical protein
MLGSKKRRRQRAEREAAFHAHVLSMRRQGWHLVWVSQTYQNARSGTKAVVVWRETGAAQDTWFQDMRVHRGMQFFVSGSIGYGPHNNNPRVLYLHPHQVQKVA